MLFTLCGGEMSFFCRDRVVGLALTDCVRWIRNPLHRCPLDRGSSVYGNLDITLPVSTWDRAVTGGVALLTYIYSVDIIQSSLFQHPHYV